MIAHSLLAQVGNLAVILLTVLLSTSVHYLFLQHLNHGSTLAIRFPQIPPDSLRLWCLWWRVL
jgi:hypothetical protein